MLGSFRLPVGRVIGGNHDDRSVPELIGSNVDYMTGALNPCMAFPPVYGQQAESAVIVGHAATQGRANTAVNQHTGE